MKNKASLFWLLLLILPIYLFCSRYHPSEVNNGNFLMGYDNSIENKFNTDLFYKNIGDVTEAADPHVICINDTYYMYATNANKNYDCSYIQCWSSKNLTNWTKEGIVFQPERDAWCLDGLWAPEVIEKNGTFYLYYSGYKITPEREGSKDFYWRGHQIGVATSSSPTGPFIDIPNADPNKKMEARFDFPYAVIDPSPFIDDDGQAYLMVTKDQYRYNDSDIHSSILIAKLKDNMIDIDGDWIEISKPDKPFENISGSISAWNEAPCMFKRDGLYYLFYSANFYQDREYCVCVSTSTSPMGPFVKYDSPLLSALDEWDYVSGTGHNSIFKSADGKEVFMAYHVHINPSLAGSERMIYFDRVNFVGDKIFVNGPSISPQPLPSGSGEYVNVAKKAKIFVNDVEVHRLNDDYINPFSKGISSEFDVGTDHAQIKIKFENLTTCRALMLYDSANYSNALRYIRRITINGKIAIDVPICSSYMEVAKTPVSAFIYEFNELETNEIIIDLESEHQILLNELVVLGK